MRKRFILSLTLCGLAAVPVLLTRTVPANPPEPVLAKADAIPAPPPSGIKTATSRVAAVTVYPNSALVTREVDVPEGPGTLELVVTPLPPQTVNSSLYTEGSDGVRVLTTRFRTRQLMEDTREDVRKLHDELKQLQLAKEKLDSDIKAVQSNLLLLTKLENPATAVHPADKGPLNSESAIALSKYIMDCRIEKSKEVVSLQQQVQLNQEKAEFARRKLNELTAGSSRLEQDAIIVVDKINAAAGKVRLNYLVNAASWRPQYKLRAGKTAKDKVHLEYLAAVVQQTGENWENVTLDLSTAQPMFNAAPPDLQVLGVALLARGSSPLSAPPNPHAAMELQEQSRNLRTQAQKDFNEKKQSSGVGLYNTAAALDQSFELLNPNAVAVKKDCALSAREGPSVTYHLNARLTVPSRNDEQIMEVARIDMSPEYYYKAVPILTAHVYRLADLTNRSNYVLLPGEATMYVDKDFVGQMNMPLVAIGEQFTVGFGVDPQLQVQRQMTDKSRNIQGGNQVLKYEFRILLSSYKSEPVKLQVWDRLPHAENENVGVSLLKIAPETSKDTLYLREQRPSNLLRWDVTVEPGMSGEKALAIQYEFKLELDRQMAIAGFQPAAGATVVGASVDHHPQISVAPSATVPPMTSTEMSKINSALAKLSPEDRKLAEAQVFCAIEEDSRLGALGPIIKVMLKNQPVFVCCRGCESEAKAHPDETLARVAKLVARVKTMSRK